MTLLSQAMESLLPFEEIQSHGMPASRSYFEVLYDSFTDEMLDLTDELSVVYFDDRPINPNGDEALLFLDHLGLKPTKKTKPTKKFPAGVRSTAKDSIEHLRYLDGDAGRAMSLFFNWREIQHRRDAFCVPILDSMGRHNLCDGSDDIHDIMGELKITRTTSRRPSMSKKPNEGVNLLNLPSRQSAGMIDGLNKRIRNGFICPPGETLSASDESQIELRLLAHFSQDELMLNIYHTGGDIHATTCERMFGIPPDQQDNDKHRKPAKNVNFMTGYGGGAHKLYTMLRQLNINDYDERQCQKFLDTFYNTYPGVAIWKEEVLWQARRDGYVSTYSGMRRYLPNLWSKDTAMRSKAEREAINHIIQGTAQDLIQQSMAWIYQRILRLRDTGAYVWLGLQLYDELIYRCGLGVVDDVERIVIDGLTNHHGLDDARVPILADSSRGRCWGEL